MGGGGGTRPPLSEFFWIRPWDIISRGATLSHYIATVQCIAFHCFLCCDISERCNKAMLVHPTVTCRQIKLMTMTRTCQRGVSREYDLAFNRKWHACKLAKLSACIYSEVHVHYK